MKRRYRNEQTEELEAYIKQNTHEIGRVLSVTLDPSIKPSDTMNVTLKVLMQQRREMISELGTRPPQGFLSRILKWRPRHAK